VKSSLQPTLLGGLILSIFLIYFMNRVLKREVQCKAS
jgi:hypothetical protein